MIEGSSWQSLTIKTIRLAINKWERFSDTLRKIFELKDQDGFFVGQVAVATLQSSENVLEHCLELKRLGIIEKDEMPESAAISSPSEIFFKISGKGLSMENKLKELELI